MQWLNAHWLAFVIVITTSLVAGRMSHIGKGVLVTHAYLLNVASVMDY